MYRNLLFTAAAWFLASTALVAADNKGKAKRRVAGTFSPSFPAFRHVLTRERSAPRLRWSLARRTLPSRHGRSDPRPGARCPATAGRSE